jgi:hypothetical protein
VGCLLVLAVLAIPRLIMFLLWILPTNYLSAAFGTWVWPLLGFFLLPTITLGYAVAENRYGGLRSWGLVLVAVGLLIDLGAIGGGRGAGRRWQERRA